MASQDQTNYCNMYCSIIPLPRIQTTKLRNCFRHRTINLLQTLATLLTVVNPLYFAEVIT